MPRRPRSRGNGTYDKPPLDLDELVSRYVERGLTVPDHDKARRYLRHIGYYRLSPYTIPFQTGEADHRFREGASFEDVLDLYVFDRALRLHTIDALERVEVAVRAAITDHMSTSYQDAHWYCDKSHFRDRNRHQQFLAMIRKECNDRLHGAPDEVEGELIHRSALEHYLVTYGAPELPPSWLMGEILTIGQLSLLFQNIRKRADRTAIAKSIGLTAPVLESWIHTFVRVRNVCAHHGRLWNVGLGVYPKIPRSPNISWLEEPDALPEQSKKRLYPVLVSLQSILDVVSPRSSWAAGLHELLESRPPMNLAGMGVPESWAHDDFWIRHITRP